jgi:hypothetical protein
MAMEFLPSVFVSPALSGCRNGLKEEEEGEEDGENEVLFAEFLESEVLSHDAEVPALPEVCFSRSSFPLCLLLPLPASVFLLFSFFFSFLEFLPVDHSVEMMVSASREAFPVSLRRSFEFFFPLLAMFSHVYCGRPFSSPRRGIGINNKPLPRFGFMTIALSLPSYCFV